MKQDLHKFQKFIMFMNFWNLIPKNCCSVQVCSFVLPCVIILGWSLFSDTEFRAHTKVIDVILEILTGTWQLLYLIVRFSLSCSARLDCPASCVMDLFGNLGPTITTLFVPSYSILPEDHRTNILSNPTVFATTTTGDRGAAVT